MLRAQSCGDTPNDVKLEWMTDQIAEIHNLVMTGATIEGVQKEMNIPGNGNFVISIIYYFNLNYNFTVYFSMSALTLSF